MALSDTERLAASEVRLDDLIVDVGEIKTELTEIRNTLLNRPPWPVVALLTFLSSAVVASTTFAIARAF